MIRNSQPQPRFLRRYEAAEYLNVPTCYLSRLAALGRGPAFFKPSPKVILYEPAELDRWLQSHRVSHTNENAAA